MTLPAGLCNCYKRPSRLSGRCMLHIYSLYRRGAGEVQVYLDNNLLRGVAELGVEAEEGNDVAPAVSRCVRCGVGKEHVSSS